MARPYKPTPNRKKACGKFSMVLTYIHDPYIGTVTTGARVSIIANRD